MENQRKAEKYEKLYSKLKSETKQASYLHEQQVKALQSKIASLQKECEQIELLKEDLRKAKKANISLKERELKQETKMKDIGKTQGESEEQLKKDIDHLRT